MVESTPKTTNKINYMNTEQAIRDIVKKHAIGFNKTIEELRAMNDNKFANPFMTNFPSINAARKLSRQIDSRFGITFENMAREIASLTYVVHDKTLVGNIYSSQKEIIENVMRSHEVKTSNRGKHKPSISEYESIRTDKTGDYEEIESECDLFFSDMNSNKHYLFELKSGGALDKGKSAEEKRKLLLNYAIASNIFDVNEDISLYLATAYDCNDYTRVTRFFAQDELMIGKPFMDLICKSENGYNWIIDEWKKNTHE